MVDKGSSYGLKHVAEHDIGYITNGVFIAAAIAEGFTVRRIRDTPNAQINFRQGVGDHPAPGVRVTADDPDDRDIIDVTVPTVEDHLAEHREYCRSVIAARAPEIGPADIATAFRGDSGAWNPADDDIIPAEPDPGESIWLEIAERVLDAVEALEDRLDRIEASLRPSE